MTTDYSFTIYTNAKDLPLEWNTLSKDSLFLTREYLTILQLASPINMTCNFIAIFSANKIVGIALTQLLVAEKLESFGDRDHCFKTTVRNFAFKRWASHVLFVGNNMLTGQNAICFAKETHIPSALNTLKHAINKLKDQFKLAGHLVHLTTIKDFSLSEIQPLQKSFTKYYTFSTQPSMVFEVQENWFTEYDYITALSKKYRDQYKRARKKSEGVEKRKLSLADIVFYEDKIYKLYYHVAKNAPFNTFFLPKNHFRIFKETLKSKFLFYGYFINEELIGFNTLIKNGTTLDTYFLGYDDDIQREKMLYLNMLYDMISYAIKHKYKEIIFARTALEIKSSVGAKPIKMYGLISHTNAIINSRMELLFQYLEPKVEWHERHPFK